MFVSFTVRIQYVNERTIELFVFTEKAHFCVFGYIMQGKFLRVAPIHSRLQT